MSLVSRVEYPSFVLRSEMQKKNVVGKDVLPASVLSKIYCFFVAQ